MIGLAGLCLGLIMSSLVLWGCEASPPPEVEPEWEPVMDRVEVWPTETRLDSLGETSRLVATVWSKDEYEVPDAEVVWVSRSPQTVQVDESGYVTALEEGSAVIEAHARGADLVGLARVVVAQLPIRLAFLSHPTDVRAGEPFEPPVSLALLDRGGSVVKKGGVEVDLRFPGEEGTLVGASLLTSDEGGVAEFVGLSVTTSGERLELVAEVDGYPLVTSDSFRVAAGRPTALVPKDGRLDLAIGEPFSLQVEARDPFGNHVIAWDGDVEVWVDGAEGRLEGVVTARIEEGRGVVGPMRLVVHPNVWNPACYSGTSLTLEIRAPELMPASVEVLQRVRVKDFIRIFTGECLVVHDGTVHCNAIGWELEPLGAWKRLHPSISSDFHRISANRESICSIGEGGRVSCQKYRFDSEYNIIPGGMHPVDSMPDAKFVALSGVGGAAQCGLLETGEAYCWGWGMRGQLGNGESTEFSGPVQVIGHRFRQISVGEFHACGVTTGGKGVCWGSGEWGALGNGELEDGFAPVEVLIPEGQEIVRIEAGYDTSCALTIEGELYCWGWQYVVDSFDVNPLPRKVILDPSIRIDGIRVGIGAACLHGAGEGYCWGSAVGFGWHVRSAAPKEKVAMPSEEAIADLDWWTNYIVTGSGKLFHISPKTYLPVESTACPPLDQLVGEWSAPQ